MKQQWAVRLVYFKNPPINHLVPNLAPDPQDFVTQEAFETAEQAYEYRKIKNEGKYSLMSELVEQLRYMGYAKELAVWNAGGPSERVVIEFYAPKGLDSREWANLNAKRMQSFGFNAVAAPVWKPGSFEEFAASGGVR